MIPRRVSRPEAALPRATVLALVVAMVVACSDGTSTRAVPDTSGRLYTKAAAPTQTVETGISVQAEPTTGRPFGLYVPTNYTTATQWPLAVMLHGNGASGEGMVLDFDAFAEEAGVVVVTPNSRGPTWDRILGTDGEYGPDVAHIDAVLKWAFDHIAVDPARISLGGFSDGGTYAILIGLKNGDLITRVAGLTPCVDVPSDRVGMPEVFISHGIHDQVLPIDDCSRFTVPRLRDRGYTVEFVEYDSDQGNGHFITEAVATQAMNFMAGR
jgi:phospholipase/carboxylesterase